jgi:hypothetical protein
MRVFPSHHKTCAFLRRRIPLCAFRVTVSRRRRQELERHLPTAQHLGTLPEGTCLRGILAVTEGQSSDDVARTFRVPPTTVQQRLRRLLVEGRHG